MMEASLQELRTCLKMHLRLAETSKLETNHGEENHSLTSSGLPR